MKKVILVFLFIFCVPWLNIAAAKSFTVTSETLQRYKKNYPRLHVGMKETEVVKLLGNPHSITTLASHKNRQYMGAIYKYYIRRKNQDSDARYYDKLITISFNQQGRLKYAFPHNLAIFEKIGFPAYK